LSEAENDIALRFRVGSLERRLDRLEELEPAVQARLLIETRDEVKSLRRGVYSLAFGVPLGAILFAFTVFEVVGR
jgi:hypothetical protein